MCGCVLVDLIFKHLVHAVVGWRVKNLQGRGGDQRPRGGLLWSCGGRNPSSPGDLILCSEGLLLALCPFWAGPHGLLRALPGTQLGLQVGAPPVSERGRVPVSGECKRWHRGELRWHHLGTVICFHFLPISQ